MVNKKGRTKCKKTSDYQGWTNYETWAVTLWISEDPDLSAMITNKVRIIIEDMQAEDSYDVTVGASLLGDFIEGFVDDGNPLSEQHNLYSDILTNALKDINYREIAEHFFEGID